MLLDEPTKLPGCGCFPTPIHRLDNLSKELDCNLFIKRDDLTGLGFSGNKIRKLQYLVREALDKGCTTLLTFGGIQTNHGRQTAAVARKYGLKSIIIASVGEEGMPEELSGNLLLDAILGCEVIFMDTSVAQKKAGGKGPDAVAGEVARLRRKTADLVIAQCEAKGEKVYEIPAGGSTALGCMGYFYAVKEIMDQLAQMDQKIDYLICPSGSKGTFSGLWLGARYFGASFEIIGSCVSPHASVYADATAGFINRVSEQYHLGLGTKAEELKILCSEYSGPAYDTPDSVTFSTIYRLARTEGIFVDPCYSGKGFTAVLKMIESGQIPSGANVMFIHTGGLPGLYSRQHLQRFNEELWHNREHQLIKPDLDD